MQETFRGTARELTEVPAMINKKCFCSLFKVAVKIAVPLADVCMVAVKDAVREPCSTVTVGGRATNVFELLSVTVTFPAGLDKITAHATLVPGAGLIFAQLRAVNDGVDHRVNVADREEEPSVAVIVPVVSAKMSLALAANDAVALPADTTTLTGDVIKGDEDVSEMVVGVEAFCDKATVQELVARDISPLGLHARDVTESRPPGPVTMPPVAESAISMPAVEAAN